VIAEASDCAVRELTMMPMEIGSGFFSSSIYGTGYEAWAGRRRIRWAGINADDIRRHAAELAALAPDVILAHGTSSVRPLQLGYTDLANGNGLPASTFDFVLSQQRGPQLGEFGLYCGGAESFSDTCPPRNRGAAGAGGAAREGLRLGGLARSGLIGAKRGL
jgi:hypothetical protein